MSRLIDADALILALETQDYSGSPESLEGWTSQDLTKAEIVDINKAPTIEAEPIKHAKWIKVGDNTYRCSRCNEVSCCNGNFCTDCGAKMDEDEISNIAKESADKIAKALKKVRAKGMQKQNIKEDDKP